MPAYDLIARWQPYHELGENYLQRLDPQARAKRLIHQLATKASTSTSSLNLP